ncbi:MAG: hypothetical protein WCK35_08260 [Chloroflexota bacterium]
MNYLNMLKRPVVLGVLALVLGLILGLMIGWVFMPVEWYDAPVKLLRSDLQEEYLRMSIDSFRVNNDETLALKRYADLGENAPDLVRAVKANPGKIDPNFITQWEQMLTRNKVLSPTKEEPITAPSGASALVSVMIIVGALIGIGLVLAAGFFLFRGGRRTGQITPAQHAADIARSVERIDYTAKGEAPPVAHYVTTYVLGDDLFDDSFSIDSPSGEFLGECGVGISETIGVGDPKKVTAFEVWMFDKNDIQTVTKVLMSPHAFNDSNFRSKLEAKGELIDMEFQKQIVMDTQTLHMIATVSDMQYGQGSLPNGSFFDRVTLELAIWTKS